MKLTAKEIALFGIFAAIMYVQQIALSFIPNVHLTGVIIIMLTVLYQWKALYPVMTYVLLVGLLNGFALWWVPYLYIWPILVVVTICFMTKIWKDVKKARTCKAIPATKFFSLGFMIINALHGLLYGTMYALLYCPITGMGFGETVTWIISGLPFDVIHGVSNFVLGALVAPLGRLIISITKYGEHD